MEFVLYIEKHLQNILFSVNFPKKSIEIIIKCVIILYRECILERVKIMKQKKENKVKVHKEHDKGQIFVRVMAAFLAVLMVVGTCGSLIYALMA